MATVCQAGQPDTNWQQDQVGRNEKGFPSLETLAVSAFQPTKNGGRGGNRTPDTGIFNPLLYRLSYPATTPAAKPK